MRLAGHNDCVNRALAASLTAGAVLWGLVIVVAPLALSHAATIPPATLVYTAASRICHQRTDRSFSVAGFQMPVCARCAGLYLTGGAGALAAWVRRARGSVRHTSMLLLSSAVPTAMTVTLEFLGIVQFSNSARALAAAPLGAAAGWVFVRMLRYDARFDGNQIFNG